MVVHYHKTVTVSTNLDARMGAPGDVFSTDFQTAGRGRLDHAWHSDKARNLMFSVVLDTCGRPPADVATLPLVVGLALANSLNSAYAMPHASFLLKWPNDILAGGKKLCGILCERVETHVIAGVGVNVNQTHFPTDIADRATSLARLMGHPLDGDALLATLVDAINVHHRRWAEGGFAALLTDYTALDALKGREVSVWATEDDPKPIAGLCGGVQPDGSLLVGTTRVYAGEAHVRNIL